MHMRKLPIGFVLLTAAAAGILSGCGADRGDFDPLAPAQPPQTSLGDTFGVTSGNRIVTFNRSTPSVRTAVAITGLQASENIVGIDLRAGGMPAGQLYALGSSGRVYSIDPASGAATLKATLAADAADTTLPFTALNGTRFGVDVNTVPDRLRVVSDTGQDLRINVDTGATTTDGTLAIGATPVTGVTEVAYTNNFAAACRTTLYYLDPAADRLLTTSDPNAGALTVVGALGVDAGAMTGFDIATAADGSNTAVATLLVGGAETVYTINLMTGAATAAGAITGLNGGETIVGLAVPVPAMTPAQAPGELLALTETNKLVSFNNGSPQKSCTTGAVSGLQASESVLGFDVRPSDGKLYALANTGRLYTVDAASGVATLKTTLVADAADTTDSFTALSGTEFGVDVNPVPDRLRVVSDTGQNLRVNMDTGATTTDTALNPAGSSVTAAAYTNSFAGATATTLYVLDVAGDRLTIQGQPSGNPNNGDLLNVGTLGITGDVGAVNAFEINGRNGAAFAALNVGAATTSDLYSINLTTGAAARVNTIAGGERVRGLAYVAAAQATVVGVTSDNRIVTFKPATPATLDTNVAITGLQGGETIFGFDSRPANGRLYALTDAGRLYTLDAATGVATPGAALAADAADTTAPFAMLAGTAFGVDFNPTVDRLRVVSDAQQSLRINVDSGATTTDTALNRAGGAAPLPSVGAAAYARNFVAGGTTTLYDIDIATNSLLIQTPPNDGVLTAVAGTLDPALTFDLAGGFDIAGGNDGLAIAALQPAGAAQSTLYRVNLATGALTAVDAIGPGGTATVTGLTIRLQ